MFCKVLWGENADFESMANKLKQMFHIGSEHKQAIDYYSIKLEQ